MRKIYLTKQDKETLNEFKQGQIDILNWLQTQFQKEIYEIRNKHADELLETPIETIASYQIKLGIFEHYKKQIQKIKDAIKNED